MFIIKFKKLHPDAKAPERAHNGDYPDVGWDLFALERVVIRCHSAVVISTGIAIELPYSGESGGVFENWVWEAQVRSRSGHRLKGLVVPVGTIDSGYRGDVGCIMVNITDETHRVEKGEKVCQLVVTKHPNICFEEVEELSDTERGEKGFGSTG